MKKQIFAFLLALTLIVSCLTSALAALKGDVDGIPGVSASDARIVLRAAVGLEILSAEQKASADVDGTDGISASDARLILRAAVGLEDLEESEDVHIHSYTKIEITREPTCTGTGTQKLACICGKEITETLDALGHSFHLTNEEAPTCRKQGKNVYTCTRCSYSSTEYIDRIDHDYQITEEKPAGCETRGYIRYECKNCASVKAEQFPATGHNYNKETGLCENCGNSDPSHYDKIPVGEKWIIEDNWEISIESVVNHPLHSTSINESQGYTDQQCVLIRYKVKSLGYKPHLENATGLIITPLDFKVYDETGTQATNYVCNHTDYAEVSIEGTSDTGLVPVVLHNDSKTITFVISEYDSDGVIRKAVFTANVID